MILRQAVKIEDIKTPVQHVSYLIGKVQKEELLRHFRIATFKTVEEFLSHIARKKGHL